jgi:hypothetical protein
MAVMLVSELNVKPPAGTPPKLTAVVPVKSWPVIVTGVPPATEPEVGLSEETPGWNCTTATTFTRLPAPVPKKEATDASVGCVTAW